MKAVTLPRSCLGVGVSCYGHREETQAPKLCRIFTSSWASQEALVVKNKPANAGDVRDMSLIPGFGRSPGEGNGNPFQYSCL